MKIAELFYPRELKDLIADLRANDDLNEEALKNLNQYILFRLSLSLFLCFVLNASAIYFQSSELIILTFILYLIAIIDVRNYVHSTSSKILFLYNYGSKVTGKCVSYGRSYHAAKFKIKAQFSVNRERFFSELVSQDKFWASKKYIEGDAILICYNPENPTSNVPFICSQAKMFYLKKTNPYVS